MIFRSSTETQSALAATQTTWLPVELRGFKEIAIQIKFGTCTGTTNTATLKLQTSNNGIDYADLMTLKSEADVANMSGDNVFAYLPDNATAGQTGFGRYIRFHFASSGTFSASYTITWEAKG